MTDTTGMKITHTVLKNEDVQKLSNHDQLILKDIHLRIAHNRASEGKTTAPTHLVINTDELYAEEIIAILKRNGHWG